jgi:hypothetical protein
LAYCFIFHFCTRPFSLIIWCQWARIHMQCSLGISYVHLLLPYFQLEYFDGDWEPSLKEWVMSLSLHSNAMILVENIWPSLPTCPLQHWGLSWHERNEFARRNEPIVWFALGGRLICLLKDFIYQLQLGLYTTNLLAS